MTILYEFHNNLYVNLTNRCPCACTFCLRQTTDHMGDSGSLWLKEEPTAAQVISEFSKFCMPNYNELVFCGFGEPIERLFLILWCAVLAVGVAQGQPVFRIQVPVLRCGLHLPEALPLSCGYVGDALHQLRVEIYHGSILLVLIWLQVFVLMIYHVLRFLSFSVAATF